MNAGYWRRYLRRASPISSFVDCQQPVLSPPVSARGFAVCCQSSSLPLPKHRGKEKPAGTAMPAGFPLSGEILVTHGSANVRSIGQARAIGKPYFISRKVFSTRRSTSRRWNASPLRNLAHVRMICNATRARSNLRHGLAGGVFIRGGGLPCVPPAETRAAQRASTPGISSPACPPRPSRRELRSRRA